MSTLGGICRGLSLSACRSGANPFLYLLKRNSNRTIYQKSPHKITQRNPRSAQGKDVQPASRRGARARLCKAEIEHARIRSSICPLQRGPQKVAQGKPRSAQEKPQAIIPSPNAPKVLSPKVPTFTCAHLHAHTICDVHTHEHSGCTWLMMKRDDCMRGTQIYGYRVLVCSGRRGPEQE